MLYRTRIDLTFTILKHAQKATESARAILPNAVIINPGSDNQEDGYISVEECYHDEDPNKACHILTLETT